MVTVLRETDNLNGILYVHDDLLLRSQIFDKIGGNEWVVTNLETNLVKLYENSTIDSIRNYTSWPFWNKCRGEFSNMFHDRRLRSYIHQATNGDLYLSITTGQSDMLYAVFPTFEIKHSFLDILELFSEHDLWLECAIPTAVSMMQERYGIKFHNAHLCTNWKKLRTLPNEMIEQCLREMKHRNIEKYGAYHPIKLGWTNDWMYYFEYTRML